MRFKSRINKAIFPVAGLGTRFLPATKASPKEMLVVVDKPLIQYAVEEAYDAGIREMIFITGRNKRAIEDHFDSAFELESELTLKGKHGLLEVVESVKPYDMDCIYLRQPRALGLGHAILCAAGLVKNEPFAVLLADDLMVARPGVMKQMIELFESYQCSIIAVQDIPREYTSRYGIAQGDQIESNLMNVKGLVEKPHPAVAPSTLAVAGRYILTPRIFEQIRKQPLGVSAEIQLTDGIAGLIDYEQIIAYTFKGHRYDCGSKLGLLQANIHLAELHPEINGEFSAWLKSRKSLEFDCKSNINKQTESVS